MDARQAKLRRLSCFRSKLPYISQNALCTVLKLARQEPLPAAADRKDIRAARDEDVQARTPYGALHQTITVTSPNGDVTFEVQHPMAMLYHMCSTSRCFSRLISRTHAANPSSPAAPWNLIVYTDEILPGNQLAYKHLRKLWGIYWSIQQFGTAVLSDEEAWFEILFARSNVTKKLCGDVSALIASVLRLFFGEGGHDAQHAGICLKLVNGSLIRIFLSLEIVIADEAALHLTYMCKGSSGLKCCVLCQNIFKNTGRSVVESDTSGFAQHHWCADSSKIVLHTSATIKAILARLSTAAGILTKVAFAELETRLGWNWVPGSLLTDARLLDMCCPSKHMLYDWMHVFCVSGVVNVHVGQLMQAMKAFRVTYSLLDEYVQEWHLPVARGEVGDMFSVKRARSSWEDSTLKATASECLSAIPIMACFFDALERRSTSQEVKNHCNCFLCLVHIMEVIQRSGRRDVDCTALQRCIDAYLASFKALYGPECMIVKFHFMIHYPAFIRRWASLPNCFALERKHKMPKRFSNEIKNTSRNFDASVLREVTCHHLAVLSDPEATHFEHDAGLIAPYPMPKKLVTQMQTYFGVGPEIQFFTARVARINAWERCCKGDTALATKDGMDLVGEIVMIVSYTVHGESIAFCILRQWDLVSEEGRTIRWRRTETLCTCLLEEIRCALTWCGKEIDMRTLPPLHT